MLQELLIKSTLVYPIEVSVYSHKFRKSAFTLEVEHALCNTCQVYLISTTKKTIILPTPVKSTCSECNLLHKNIRFVGTYCWIFYEILVKWSWVIIKSQMLLAMEERYFNSLSRTMSSFEVEKISHAAAWLLLLYWHLAKNNKDAPVEKQKQKNQSNFSPAHRLLSDNNKDLALLSRASWRRSNPISLGVSL